MIKCKNCDYENEEDSNYCVECGKSIIENNKDDDDNGGILESIGNFVNKLIGGG